MRTGAGRASMRPIRGEMLRRSANDRVLTGVAGGIGERLGIDPVVVRLAFVVLALAGGVGVLLYVAAALTSRAPDPDRTPPSPRSSSTQAVAVALVVLGVMVMLREAGLWFGDRIVWPAAVAILGSAAIWTRGEAARAPRGRLWSRLPPDVKDALSASRAWVRAAAGGALVLGGLVSFVTSNRTVPGVGGAPLAVATCVLGLGVIGGPWLMRLARDVAEERRERIRQEERAEMAAHLHDSVLQTLALIQRAHDVRDIMVLARSQERELRSWLYGKRRRRVGDLLSSVVDDIAEDVERTHRVRVDVVLVGDCRLTDRVRALTDALREAIVNAARHAAVAALSVYIEVEPDAVTAFVRDHGVGFARDRVPLDRRGIADSIEGRMARNGGDGVVVSEPGRGTEVRLRVLREASAR
jgi:signal transduction histidine kinase/phage shock protein PspC (stress-responsive transcriptional regulator)